MTEVTYGPMTGRRMSPTKRHRKVLWEGILGTVYARSLESGEIQYFDYDWEAALEFIGPHQDVRIWRETPKSRRVVWARGMDD